MSESAAGNPNLTYAEMQSRIQELQKEADQLRRQEVPGVISRIKEAIAVYNLKPNDLFEAVALQGGTAATDTAQTSRGQQAGRVQRPEGKGGGRFTDGQGNYWSGMGRKPKWIIEGLAAGKTLDDFLAERMGASEQPAQQQLDAFADEPAAEGGTGQSAGTDGQDAGASEAAAEAAPAAAAAPAPAPASPRAAKKSAAAAPAAKKTGTAPKGTIRFRLGDQEWTGMGPKPKWVKEALESGKTMDDLRA